MRHYIDLVQNQYGNPIQGVSCTVLMYPSNALANIFSDNGITQTANPVTTNAQGAYSFYAPNGRYSIAFTGAGVVKDTIVDILIEDPTEANSYNITGGSVNNTPIGATTPSTGAFTTLTASSLSLAAYNGPVGTITPNVGTFSTLTATNLNVTNVASVTVSNAQLAANSNTLLGSTWVSPGAIGDTVKNSGKFTSLLSTGVTQLGATVAASIDSTPLGATTPSTGSFTTLAVSSGINAIPIGATTPSTGSFTALNATSGINSTVIGATTPLAGTFTTLNAVTGTFSTSVTSNAILSNGALGIGYSTGAGSSVTQITSKATPVSLSKTCGRITLSNSSLAAATSASFTLTNTTIAATDVVLVSIASGATTGAYNVIADTISVGSCVISIRNLTAGALAEAVVLNFVVIKSVIA